MLLALVPGCGGATGDASPAGALDATSTPETASDPTSEQKPAADPRLIPESCGDDPQSESYAVCAIEHLEAALEQHRDDPAIAPFLMVDLVGHHRVQIMAVYKRERTAWREKFLELRDGPAHPDFDDEPDMSRAIALADEVIERYPESPARGDALEQKSRALHEAGNLEAAFHTALDLVCPSNQVSESQASKGFDTPYEECKPLPADPRLLAHAWTAVARLDACTHESLYRDDDQRIVALRRALEVGPDWDGYRDTRAELGHTLVYDGQYKEALALGLEMAQDLKQIQNDQPAVYERLYGHVTDVIAYGLLRYETPRPRGDEITKSLERLQDPAMIDQSLPFLDYLYSVLGSAIEHTDEPLLAIPVYESFLEHEEWVLSDSALLVILKLGDLYRQAGKKAKANAMLDRLLGYGPNSEWTTKKPNEADYGGIDGWLIADALQLNGRPRQARKILEATYDVYCHTSEYGIKSWERLVEDAEKRGDRKALARLRSMQLERRCWPVPVPTDWSWDQTIENYNRVQSMAEAIAGE